MAKIKQLFCRHMYADKNLDIVEISQETVRLRNYCVKCGKPYEVRFSYSCMFGEVDVRIMKELVTVVGVQVLPELRGKDGQEEVRNGQKG